VKTPKKATIEPAKPTTAVTKINAVATPAPTAAWPTQQKVKDLAETLDRRHRDFRAMKEFAEKLEGTTHELSRKHIVQEAQRFIERFEAFGGRGFIKNRLEKIWDECRPESWWPEDSDTPARSQVTKMITGLMGSFPTSNIPAPEIFVPVLLDDVMALEPSFVELEATCRELRKTKKFMPSIAEVIEALEEQQEEWSRRRSVVWHMEEYYDDLCTEIAKEKAEEERRAKEAEEAARAAAEREAAKALPIVVGDRVHTQMVPVPFLRSWKIVAANRAVTCASMQSTKTKMNMRSGRNTWNA